MKKFFFYLILLLASADGFAQVTIVTFLPDTSLFPNPETGPFYSFSSTGTQTFMPALSNGTNTLNNYRTKYGFSTVFYSYYIGDWKYTDLPQYALDRIDEDMATARNLGYKVIPHFHYAYEYQYENPMVWTENEKDAKKDIIVKHCAQLKQILKKNADVIAVMGWGMIGPWGEMWISSSWNVGDSTAPCCNKIKEVNENTKAIIRSEMDATPSDRMITFVPNGKRQLYNISPLDSTEAFTGTDKSRMGIINQCFLTDQNAYDPTYISNSYRGPRSYLASDGLYVPQIAFPDVTGCGYRPTAKQLIEEMDAGHWDFIQGVGVAEKVMQSNLDNIQVQKIFKSIGYRYQLKSARVPAKVEAGKTLEMNVQIANLNGGTLFNPRGIEIILRNIISKQKYVFNIKGDNVQNRLYFPKPHSEKSWALTLAIPDSTIPGNYEVLLNLPDPYPSIHDRPEYSIHLANMGVWDQSTGYNSLLCNISVQPKNPSDEIADIRVNSITIYPNPAENIFQIVLNNFRGGNKVKASLYNLLGKLVYQIELDYSSVISFDIPKNLIKGFYILRVNNGENYGTKKVIIQ